MSIRVTNALELRIDISKQVIDVLKMLPEISQHVMNASIDPNDFSIDVENGYFE